MSAVAPAARAAVFNLDQVDARTFLDCLPAAAIIVDSAGKMLAVNPDAGELLELPPTVAAGRVAEGAFHLFLQRARRLATASEAPRFEHPYGSRWYSVSYFPLRTGSDVQLHVLSAADITATKNAEFDIRESEARLEEATRIAQLGTFKLYWDTGRIQWSPHIYTMHGLSPVSFVHSAEQYRQLIHPEDYENHARIRRDLIDGKRVRGAEFRIVRTDGAIRWLRVDARVLFDADGEPYASFGTCQDISEAKLREQELKSLLRRNTILYEALDASPIGVSVVTTDYGAPQFFYVNAEFERLTRHNTSSLSENGIATLRPKDDIDDGWARVLQTLAESGSGAFELTCARRDGATFLAQVEVAPVRDCPGRDTTVFVLNLRDITIERQRTEALLQSQKLEALGQLSGGVAHEISNLLQPMLALSELGQDIADTDPVKVRQFFEVIASSGRKARDLVRQVLTFARRDAPQLALHSISALVSDALQLLQSGLPLGIRLQQRLDADNARSVVNPTQVSQVVLNLVANAADAMNGQGAVAVSLDVLDLDDDGAAALMIAPGRWVLLRVVDDGCGMDAYTMSRIFEPFYTTKAAGKGTGLGLSVVYSIVTGWGGTIKMESDVDKGTTAMVYIPAARDTQPRGTE